MSKWLIRMALAGMFGLASLGLFPTPAAAAFNANTQITVPAPVVMPLTAGDFSDADFTSADQPELGTLTGGDAGGLLIFILVVILLVLLILWLLNASPGHSSHVEVRAGPGNHGHGH